MKRRVVAAKGEAVQVGYGIEELLDALGLDSFPGADLALVACVETYETVLRVDVDLSHVVVGAMLIVSRTRFLGALLQLPISIGIG